MSKILLPYEDYKETRIKIDNDLFSKIELGFQDDGSGVIRFHISRIMVDSKDQAHHNSSGDEWFDDLTVKDVEYILKTLTSMFAEYKGEISVMQKAIQMARRMKK